MDTSVILSSVIRSMPEQVLTPTLTETMQPFLWYQMRLSKQLLDIGKQVMKLLTRGILKLVTAGRGAEPYDLAIAARALDPTGAGQ
eukprot:4199541-Amphidinium_carterae.1